MKTPSLPTWTPRHTFKGCNEPSWHGDKNSGFRDDEPVCAGAGFHGVAAHQIASRRASLSRGLSPSLLLNAARGRERERERFLGSLLYFFRIESFFGVSKRIV